MKRMIKNIVFDMGGVLIRWDPEGFVRDLGLNEADSALLLENVYGNPLWAQMDWGNCSEQDVYDDACTKLPERLHEYAHRLVFKWCWPVQPLEGMEEFVAECKQAGKMVYLLSNASHRQKDYWPTIPASRYFDGRVVSAEIGHVKPGREIFEHLLNTYGLKAEECVFIDDLWQNVLGAMKAGLHGVVFDGDVARLRRILSLM